MLSGEEERCQVGMLLLALLWCQDWSLSSRTYLRTLVLTRLGPEQVGTSSFNPAANPGFGSTRDGEKKKATLTSRSLGRLSFITVLE